MRCSSVLWAVAWTAPLICTAQKAAAPASARDSAGGFVQVSQGALTLNGAPFRFGGADCFVLMLAPHAAVDQILETASANHFQVIRMWAADDIGVPSSNDTFYLQYWNGSAPAYNDGDNGLANVDYAIYRAGQLGIKLIIPLVNNWPDYGGMDQYVNWRGGGYHDQFYTDPTIRQWYKGWISHILTHVNTISGVAYKDDPAIMAWELANEPECRGGGLPGSGTCTPQTIVSWINDVAPYIKSIDPHHLVSAGDEGFFCVPGAAPGDWIENCFTGVDNLAFAGATGVDLLGFHLYPETWGQTMSWAETFITQHLADAAMMGKPAYMGEYGVFNGNIRNALYQDWTNLILTHGGSGALFWDMQPGAPSPLAAEESAGLDVEAGSPILATVGNFAQMMAAGVPLAFPPVAGDQWATTMQGTPVTLNPLENDVAYGGATVDAASITLNPGAAGGQSSLTVYGGTFTIAGQSVQFSPAPGFNGTAQGSYAISDSTGAQSNIAYLFAAVRAALGDWATLEAFEAGSDGWQPLAPAAGILTQSAALHTDGNYSLQVDVTNGGWFGAVFPSPVDVTGRPFFAIDIETPSAPGSSAFAFQSGSNWVWCQSSNWAPLPANSITTVTIPLDQSQIACYGGTPDLTDILAVYVYLAGPGTYYLDDLRAAPQTAATPLPSIAGVGNAASGQPGISPGAYVSIYGSNFAPSDVPAILWSNWIDGGKLPTSVAGVSVSVGGLPAYVYAVLPSQINILAPDVGAGSTEVIVTTSAGASQPFPVTSQTLSPALFTWGQFAVATHLDFSLAIKSGSFGVTATPAKPGEYIIFWGTGFGATNPPAPEGQVVPLGSYSVNGVTATVGDEPATVAGTALGPGLAGVYQVAIQIPSGLPAGDYAVVAAVDGSQTQAGVLITVQP